MGADDLLVNKAKQELSIKDIRGKYSIEKDDFLIMTGGKIDLFKTQTLLLMQAVHNIRNEKLKLIVFGSVAPELKEKIADLSDGKKVQYIGWIEANDSYDYFATADLVVFPGRHSVFWEQVAGMGIPMIVKYWDGTTHIDGGGNVEFLNDDSVDEITEKILKISSDELHYKTMKNAAEQISKKFSYSSIAQRSICEESEYDEFSN